MHVNKLTAFIFGCGFSIIVFIASGLLAHIEPVSAQTTANSDQQDQQFAPQGADTCLSCHNDPVVTSVLDTPHRNSAIAGSPFARQDCESCHGASPTHVRGLQSPAVVFTGSDRYEVSDVDAKNQI